MVKLTLYDSDLTLKRLMMFRLFFVPPDRLLGALKVANLPACFKRLYLQF